MRVWIEYEGGHNRKTDEAVEKIGKRHLAKFTGSGMDLSEHGVRDLEYKISPKNLSGFFTEVTDKWKKFKIHRVVVHAK